MKKKKQALSVAAATTAAAAACCSFAASSSRLASFSAQPSRGFAAGASTTDLTSEIEHATGIERWGRMISRREREKLIPLLKKKREGRKRRRRGKRLAQPPSSPPPPPTKKPTKKHSDELLAKASGKDLFHEDWLDAPWGTAEAPVVVTSSFSERVVGVPDSYDDSIIWWGTIREGEGPRQLVEGGEYFVLKRVGDGGGHH